MQQMVRRNQQPSRGEQNASQGDWDGSGSGGQLQAKHNKVSTLPPSLSDQQGDSKLREIQVVGYFEILVAAG
jgi:hypothetical protein